MQQQCLKEFYVWWNNTLGLLLYNILYVCHANYDEFYLSLNLTAE